jgi:hypothetical protein
LKPVVVCRLPFHAWGFEQNIPIYDSRLKAESFLVSLSSSNESMSVDLLEKGLVRRKGLNKSPDVGSMLLMCCPSSVTELAINPTKKAKPSL